MKKVLVGLLFGFGIVCYMHTGVSFARELQRPTTTSPKVTIPSVPEPISDELPIGTEDNEEATIPAVPAPISSELPIGTENSDKGYFKIHYYANHDELELVNPTNELLTNVNVWILSGDDFTSPFMTLGTFTLQAGESKIIDTEHRYDGNQVKNVKICAKNIGEEGALSPDLTTEMESWNVEKAYALVHSTPVWTQTSPNGYFTIHHYVNFDELIFNNPTSEELENKAVLVMSGDDFTKPFAKVGDFSLKAGESRRISTEFHCDGKSVKNIVLANQEFVTTEVWDISANAKEKETTYGSTNGKEKFSPGNPIYETRGFTANDVDLHYHTTVFSNGTTTLKVRMILTDYEQHEYIFKTLAGQKNALSRNSFQLSGALEHATISNINVIQNPSDGVTVGEFNDYGNSSIYEVTFTDIDTAQDKGTFTLKAGSNRFGKDFSQSVYFEGVNIQQTTPQAQILDANSGANPTYTVHFAVENGVIADTLRNSDISFQGALSDCQVTSILLDDDMKGFTLHFKKTDLHYVAGASKEGKILIAPSKFLYASELPGSQGVGPSYSAQVRLEVVDTFVPPIEYDSKSSNDISFSNQSLTTRCVQTAPKIIGDILKEIAGGKDDVKLRNCALCKSMAFAGVGLDILFTLLKGQQNDLVMEQLEMMDRKLDNMNDGIGNLYTALYENGTREIARQQLTKLEDDTNAMLLDDSYLMRFDNATHAMITLNKGEDVTDATNAQLVRYLQELFSTKDNKTDILRLFKQYAADISGASNYTFLSGKSIFDVSNDYQSVVNDWTGTSQLAERKQFLEQVKNQYGALSSLLTFAIEFDKELNERQQQNYLDWQKSLNEVDTTNLTAQEAIDIQNEKNKCEVALADLKAPLQTDERLLSTGEGASELDSVEKASKTIYEKIDEEEKSIQDMETIVNRGNIYSNRIKKWVKSDLHREWDLDLFLCYFDDSHFRDHNKLTDIIDTAKNQAGAVHNKGELLTKSEIDFLNNSAKARNYSSLLAEIFASGFTHPAESNKVLFSGRCEKPYDSWGSLWNSGYCYADVYAYDGDTFSESRRRCMSYEVGSWGGYHWDYHAGVIFYLQYGG